MEGRVLIGAEKWIFSLQKDTDRPGQNTYSRKRKEKFLILLSNPYFLLAVESLKKSFDIPPLGFSNYKTSLSWAIKLYKSKKKMAAYEIAIHKILLKFKIGSLWQKAVEYYLLYNREDADHLIPYPVNICVMQEDNDEMTLNLQIYKDTELSDITKIFPQIKKHQAMLGYLENNEVKSANTEDVVFIPDKKLKKLWRASLNKPKKFKSHHQFDMHRKAYFLKQRGKTTKEIADILECEYNRVSNYVRRFEKAIEQNELP